MSSRNGPELEQLPLEAREAAGRASWTKLLRELPAEPDSVASGDTPDPDDAPNTTDDEESAAERERPAGAALGRCVHKEREMTTRSLRHRDQPTTPAR